MIRNVVLLLAPLASPAMAAPITVPNFSFEIPHLADGSGSSVVTDWSYIPTGVSGVNTENYNDVSYPGSTGDTSPLPGTADGAQAIAPAGSPLTGFGVDVDNVRLNATTVPEPAATPAVIGLLAFGRRLRTRRTRSGSVSVPAS